uniref:Reverse transcriptase domain-containing protein n=1 Tax=Lactuca sativa TaxID=4236 RepID=A0A9R1XBR1_LACSA|nr:hypothetical protein LSAT_V11C500271200 [Lactuca sativa]
MEYPEQVVRTGAHLSGETRAQLVALLKKYSTVFTWKPTDLKGVDQQDIEHNLNITLESNLVKQKKKGQANTRTGLLTQTWSIW